jgi:hypothetical protein
MQLKAVCPSLPFKNYVDPASNDAVEVKYLKVEGLQRRSEV